MKVLLLSLKGLGDTVMQIPLIRAIKAGRPDAEITTLVPDDACAEVFRNCPYVSPIVVGFRRPGPGIAVKIIKLLHFLRAEKFDASVTTFPSNRVWYNLLARWAGAPLRVTHSYGFARLRTLAFLQNRHIAAPVSRHELDHNMALLQGLGIPEPEKKDLSPWLTGEDRAYASSFLKNDCPSGDGPLIGLHPAINQAQIYKAWDPSNADVFAALSDWLAWTFRARTIIFSGPDEHAAADRAAARCRTRPAVCRGATVNQAAALMERCSLFINTDSGLGHLAASVGTPTVTVFGPANPAMTAPYGASNRVLSAGAPCIPCYDYPYSSLRPRLKCDARSCLERIDLEALKTAAAAALNAGGNSFAAP